MWLVYASLSAVFAALTTIFAKIGIRNVNSNLATALRTMVVLIPACGLVFLTGVQKRIPAMNRTSWIFIILSGLATGASWLAYFKAIQIGNVSKVVPIDKLSIFFVLAFSVVFLKEPLTWKTIVGGLLVCVGTFILAI